MESPPEIFVIAGPNGAGKSTAAASILPRRFPTRRFLNADDIARALGHVSPIEAGRVMLERMHELRMSRETFAFETTLSGRTQLRFLDEAARMGYQIHIAYVCLASAELAKTRVAARVSRGGHDVPASDIERRFCRGIRNFLEFYQPLANTWVLCDNTSEELVIVARGTSEQAATVYDQSLFDRIRRAAEPS